MMSQLQDAFEATRTIAEAARLPDLLDWTAARWLPPVTRRGPRGSRPPRVPYALKAATVARRDNFALGLEVLLAVRGKGERFSLGQIARACGCSHQNVDWIEKRALKKLREKVRSELGIDWNQFFTGGSHNL